MLDDDDVVLVAGRRARQSIADLVEGEHIPDGPVLSGDRGVVPLIVPYEIDGSRERLVYLSQVGDMTAYEELRTGFTAAVSHELRTPLARLLSLLETAALPGENVDELVEQARAEVEQIRELIDEVLFLSELESGSRVVSLGTVAVLPELDAVVDELEERASRAGVELAVVGDPAIELELRPRMLRVVAQNLAENAIRYAGPGAAFTLAVERTPEGDRPTRHRRRGRRRRGGADQAVRALLPRRPGAGVPRYRSGAGDRQARRHAGRRHGGSPRRPGRGSRSALRVLALAVAARRYWADRIRAPRSSARGVRFAHVGVGLTSSFTSPTRDLHQPSPHCAVRRRDTGRGERDRDRASDHGHRHRSDRSRRAGRDVRRRSRQRGRVHGLRAVGVL